MTMTFTEKKTWNIDTNTKEYFFNIAYGQIHEDMLENRSKGYHWSPVYRDLLARAERNLYEESEELNIVELPKTIDE